MGVRASLALAIGALALTCRSQNSIPEDQDPCLDPKVLASKWVDDNMIRPNYIPATTEEKPSQ